jgi:hypothetical protein
MSKPYDFKRINQNIYGDKRLVEGKTIALLHIIFEDRGLKLIEAKSRAVKINEIHELMITDEDAMPGLKQIGYELLAFSRLRDQG